MSFIKEIYDVTKDLANNKIALNKIRKSLLRESKLNDKFLVEIADTEKRLKNERLIEIVNNLEMTEMKAAISCGIPFELISLIIVTKDLMEGLDPMRALGNDLETVLEKIFIKIAYLKKDYKSEHINLFIRVRNIYNYNQLLMRMLLK